MKKILIEKTREELIKLVLIAERLEDAEISKTKASLSSKGLKLEIEE